MNTDTGMDAEMDTDTDLDLDINMNMDIDMDTDMVTDNLDVYYTGWAVNCGLFFAGPMLSPLGAASKKISENRWAVA
jgi:hypothetical protein